MSTAATKPGLYLYDANGQMKIKGTKSGAVYQAISGVERFVESDPTGVKSPRYKEGIKIMCGLGNTLKKTCLDKSVFDHTMSSFSKQLANMDLTTFVNAITKEIRKVNDAMSFAPAAVSTPKLPTTSRIISASMPSSSSSADGDVDIFEYHHESSSLDGGVVETPQRKRSKNTVTDLKGLKSSGGPKSALDIHRTTFKNSVTDVIVSVNLCQLSSGEQFPREVNAEWVAKLKASMIKIHYTGAPLAAVANAPSAQYDPSKPNAYRYTVIGGCHRLKAAKQLNAESRDINRSMDVQIYGSDC